LTNYNQGAITTPKYVLEATQRTSALYFQEVWKIINNLSLTTGMRYTWKKTSIDRFERVPE
jgi:outer membrane receptor protein involved in Fe transport